MFCHLFYGSQCIVLINVRKDKKIIIIIMFFILKKKLTDELNNARNKTIISRKVKTLPGSKIK